MRTLKRRTARGSTGAVATLAILIGPGRFADGCDITISHLVVRPYRIAEGSCIVLDIATRYHLVAT